MKKTVLTLLCLIVLLTSKATAQSRPCGVSGDAGPESAYSTLLVAPSNPIWVNVYYHIVQDANGGGGVTPAYLCTQTNYLNQWFNPYGIYFNYVGYDEIRSDYLFNFNETKKGALFGTNTIPNAINIYEITRPWEWGGLAAGMPSNAFAITNTDAISLVHEMGHCLGLLHTNAGTNSLGGGDGCVELVDGSNCSNCGDQVCDTPADPGLAGRVTSDCQFDNSITQNGVPYTPDVRNIMSYADGCRDHFTPMQVARMYNKLQSAIPQVINSSMLFTISGPDKICTPYTYSIGNMQPGYWVSGWSSSNPSVATINSAGTLSFTGSGKTTISATLTNGACQTVTLTKNVSVGPGTIGGTYSYSWYTFPVTGSTSIGLSNSANTVYFSLNNPWDPATSYTWNINSQRGYGSYSFNGKNANISLSAGAYMSVTCTAGTPCGPISVSFSCYNYSGSYLAYPNPADETITVTAVKELVSDDKINDKTFIQSSLIATEIEHIPVKIFDKNNKILAQGELLSGRIDIPVKNLSNGVYYLHIGQGKELVKKQIIIQH